MSLAVFKAAMAHLAGGVVIVTTADPAGARHGMTATAVCSVSLEPPLVMACMSRDAATHRAVSVSGAFALNLLSEKQFVVPVVDDDGKLVGAISFFSVLRAVKGWEPGEEHDDNDKK